MKLLLLSFASIRVIRGRTIRAIRGQKLFAIFA